MCSILSHCELQKPLRDSTVNLVLMGTARSSKEILSVESLRVAGTHWVTEPSLELGELLSRFLRGAAVWEATGPRGLSPSRTQNTWGTSSLTDSDNNILKQNRRQPYTQIYFKFMSQDEIWGSLLSPCH